MNVPWLCPFEGTHVLACTTGCKSRAFIVLQQTRPLLARLPAVT
jgi:hypothetical protein